MSNETLWIVGYSIIVFLFLFNEIRQGIKEKRKLDELVKKRKIKKKGKK